MTRPKLWNVELLLSGGVRVTFLATEIRQKQHSDLVKTFIILSFVIEKYCIDPNRATVVAEQVAVRFTSRNAKR